MAAGDIGIRFAAEGDQTLKSAIKAIDDQLKALNEGIKASTEAMKGMSGQEDATAQKNEMLAKSIEANKQKLELLSREYEDAKSKLADLGREMEEAKKSNDPAAIDKATKAYNKQSSEVSKLEGSMNKAEGEISKAQNSIDGLGDEMEETAKSTGVLGEGFTVVKGVITNLITDAIEKLVSSLKDAAKYMMESGMSFESTMSNVQAVSGASADEMSKLSDKAQEMGSKTKFSATEAGEAFSYMAMAGWKTEDMLDGIEGVMNLAAASGSDLATASDIVTDALTAMGYGAQDAGKLADVMAAASANANTNVEMMGETFKYAAPVIGTLGYNMEDAAVAIGLMANAGIKGSQAGTALRSTLTNLASPSDEAAMAMEKYGISLTDSQGKMKPLSQVMQELREKFKTMTETEKAQVASTIAGKNAMSGFLAIVGSSDEDFNKLTEAIGGSSGAAQQMSDTMQDNLAGSITKLKSAAEGVAITLYNAFSSTAKTAVNGLAEAVGRARERLAEWAQSEKAQEMFKRIADAVQGLVDKFLNNLEPAMDAVIGVIEAIVQVAGDLISNWDKIAVAIEIAAKAFIAVKAAMAALQLVQLVSNITPVGAAITALIAVITLLVTHWDQVKEVAAACWEKIKGAWNNAATWFKGIVTGIQNAFTGIGDKIAGFFSGAWTKVKNAWNGVGSFFGDIVSTIQGKFGPVGQILSAGFQSGWNSIKAVWGAVTGYFQNIWNTIKGIFSAVESVFKGDFQGAWNAIKNIVGQWANYFKTVWNSIKTVFEPLTSTFKNIFTNAWNGIKSAWSGVTSFFQNIGSNIKTAISNSLSNLPSMAVNWAKDMMQGFGRGITNFMSSVTAPIQNLASKISSFLHFSHPDEGPLRDYETWMPDFVRGLARGLTRSAPILGEAAEGLAGQLAAGASSVSLGTAAAESGAQPIYLQVDGQTFARLMTGYIDRQQGENWTNSMALGLA